MDFLYPPRPVFIFFYYYFGLIIITKFYIDEDYIEIKELDSNIKVYGTLEKPMLLNFNYIENGVKK
jgi:hypothetical protein